MEAEARTIIDDLGGTVAVATALGLPPSTVSSWKSSGRIQKWRKRDLDELRVAQVDHACADSGAEAPASPGDAGENTGPDDSTTRNAA